MDININYINEQIKKINYQIRSQSSAPDVKSAADVKEQKNSMRFLRDQRASLQDEKDLIDIKYILPDDIVDTLFRESVEEGVDCVYNGKEESPGSLTGWSMFVGNECITKISEIFTNKLKKYIKLKHNSKSALQLIEQRLDLDPESETGKAHLEHFIHNLKKGGKKFTKKKNNININMVNWKTKYLKMKLKYINAKQTAGMFGEIMH